MTGRGAMLAACMVVAVATLTAAAIPGPRNLRYPDSIVYPRVDCKSEGVFLHPRNCSWYYRCVDHMSVGYYRTYYFECEPGTVFDDELDQCVFPSLANPPCGKPGEVNVTTIVTCRLRPQECHQYAPCYQPRTRTLCDGCYNEKIFKPFPHSLCIGTKLFDKGRNRCVPRPPSSHLCPMPDFVLPSFPPPASGFFPTATQQPSQITTTAPNVIVVPLFDIPCTDEARNHVLIDFQKDLCYEYCTSNTQGRRWLCPDYYHCTQAQGGAWEVELKTCHGETLFGENADQCAAAPSDAVLC